MITVAEAQRRIAAAFSPIDAELVDLAHLAGRVATDAIKAHTDQPPLPVSAMRRSRLRFGSEVLNSGE